MYVRSMSNARRKVIASDQSVANIILAVQLASQMGGVANSIPNFCFCPELHSQLMGPCSSEGFLHLHNFRWSTLANESLVVELHPHVIPQNRKLMPRKKKLKIYHKGNDINSRTKSDHSQ